MFRWLLVSILRVLVAGAMTFCLVSAAACEEQVAITEISPTVLVVATSSGNVVVSVGADGAVLIGTPSAASTGEISKILAGRTRSPLRYVVIAPEPLSRSQGDAGWGRRGAFVAMQEKGLERLGGHHMGPAAPLPEELAKLGVQRPPLSFSEVLSLDVNREAIHIIHQAPAFSDADSVVHFHAAGVIYLGEVFPGDGYPLLDPALGGDFDGLVKLLGSWSGGPFRIVPARGKVADGAALKEFRDMLVAVHDRVQKMIGNGESEAQIVAQHPTAEFDSRWGHGRVHPDDFVRAMYKLLAPH